jgi:hypothetical protein
MRMSFVTTGEKAGAAVSESSNSTSRSCTQRFVGWAASNDSSTSFQFPMRCFAAENSRQKFTLVTEKNRVRLRRLPE